MALPEPAKSRLRAANAADPLNREIRRRKRVAGIFPNEEAALKLLGAVLMEIDEAWATSRRYSFHGGVPDMDEQTERR